MDGITLGSVTEIIRNLGWGGAFVLFFFYEITARRREDEARRREDEARRKENEAFKDLVLQTLKQYREDLAEFARRYESNVRLVDSYDAHTTRLEKIYQETMSVIALNTQTQADLVNAIKHNDFCPVVRGGAGK